MFDKKAFSSELEIDELLSFFNECDLFPAQTEIQDAITAMFKGTISTFNATVQPKLKLCPS